jgi:drug/metabolite transporter (DMT)-like permease
MLCGFVLLVIGAFVFEGNPLRSRWTPIATLSLFYLTIVGSVIAFILYYWLVRNMDVTKTMLIALVTPFIAVLLGLVVLDERLTWRTLAGGALIMCGIALVVLRKRTAP